MLARKLHTKQSKKIAKQKLCCTHLGMPFKKYLFLHQVTIIECFKDVWHLSHQFWVIYSHHSFHSIQKVFLRFGLAIYKLQEDGMSLSNSSSARMPVALSNMSRRSASAFTVLRSLARRDTPPALIMPYTTVSTLTTCTHYVYTQTTSTLHTIVNF